MKFIPQFRSDVWTVAFRPFFLAVSLHAIFALLIWVLILFSVIPSPFLVGGIQMHSYEMVYGFGRAAVVGFIFTAGQYWTKSVLIEGKALAFLFSLWFLGRFSFLASPALSYAAVTFDLYFDILVLFYILPALFKKGQEHNRVVAITYFLFSLLHLLTAFSFLGVVPSDWSMHLIHLSIFVVLQFVAIIAGRILPFFTSVAVAGSNPRRFPHLETAIQYSGFIFLILETATHSIPGIVPFVGVYCFFLSVLHFTRWYFWEPWKSVRTPILWILHSGYFWLCFGFFGFGLYHLGVWSASSAFHLFNAGAIGVFVYGMITRVSLGHTGRLIRASKATVVGYVLINLAVITRVFLPIWNLYREAYFFSAIFWITSFLIFFLQYAKILISPRVDFQSKPRV